MPATTESPWTWAWVWWGTLVAINAINLTLCIFLFIRSTKDPHPVDARYQGLMRIMGLVFLGVAFYRSIFVASYLEQLAWFNSLLNSSLLIRCLAIFAELSFAGLIAKSLLRMNAEVPELIPTRNKLAAILQTRAPIILIFVHLDCQFVCHRRDHYQDGCALCYRRNPVGAGIPIHYPHAHHEHARFIFVSQHGRLGQNAAVQGVDHHPGPICDRVQLLFALLSFTH